MTNTQLYDQKDVSGPRRFRLFHIIPPHLYANILSFLNLCCGIAGCIAIKVNHNAPMAFSLMFLGQFLDLFDGRAAEKWGSTPNGDLLDDIADGTSFGICVSFVIFSSFTDSRIGLIVALIHASSTIFRLVRFVIRKRGAGVTGGVAFFSGMPCPAGALVVGSAAIVFPQEKQWELVKLTICILTSILTVSTVTYPHFGRYLIKLVNREVFYSLLSFTAGTVFTALFFGRWMLLIYYIHVMSLIYLISPCFARYAERERNYVTDRNEDQLADKKKAE